MILDACMYKESFISVLPAPTSLQLPAHKQDNVTSQRLHPESATVQPTHKQQPAKTVAGCRGRSQVFDWEEIHSKGTTVLTKCQRLKYQVY